MRLLALMTASKSLPTSSRPMKGRPKRARAKAFGSLLIVMVSTLATMVVVGPAIYALADVNNTDMSVFTQTMDKLLPAPLAYAGTLVGIVVLLSAAAASAQGLQNLTLGLRQRHYVPAVFWKGTGSTSPTGRCSFKCSWSQFASLRSARCQ